MKNQLLAATMLLGISGTVLATNRDVLGSAPAACKVQGVWERTATIVKGKRTEFVGAKQYKLVTRTHYTWLSAATRRDTLPFRTSLDSANFYSMSGGYGTYKVSGHKYTEQIDLFVDPRLEGKSLTASCQVDGNRWIHTYRESDLGTPTPGTTASPDSVTEIWRRVE
jgi:hypothetical protein